MLKNLNIRNYAIIDKLELDFDDGFSVFTGETGAGKSIIVGALSYLIKGKADPSVIRSNAEKAIIEGVFSVDEEMKDILTEADIDFDDEIIVRRVISRDNRNSIRVNDTGVTLNFLTSLFEEHIDIHSQKDSQYLLNKKNHLKLLDKYINEPELIAEYKTAYNSFNKAQKEYDELNEKTYNQAELEFYRFDLNELNEASLDLDEEDELIAKEKRYKSAEKYLMTLNGAVDLYDGNGGIDEKLSVLLKTLNLDDPVIESTKEKMQDLYYSFKDEMDKLKKLLNEFSDEDLNIDHIEERLYTYSKLKRKHATDTKGLIAKREELKDKIAFFEDREFVLAEKKKTVDELYVKAKALADKLSDIRKQKAVQLENQISEQCRELLLPNVVFKIDIAEMALNPSGKDDIEFFVAMNKGEEPKPLRNVASGGEISRLMLALKAVFTALSDTSLVIFDEIDSGVSGKVALAIGQKIAQIARNTQVLCITHLAAVAACADSHYYIFKSDDEGYSNTSVKRLEHEDIIKELATISTSETSTSALEAAEELYASAQASIGK
ncbi:MAG: DNA repair protein RecN [Erysipelotrichaceae bacterium]|nr:DNA repair protein RecN [Erysipelotrichaceae bacterium]